MIHIVFLGEKR